MNNLVLGCKKARPTGQLLASVLGWEYREAFEIGKHYDFVFRYGNSDWREERGVGTYINNAHAIKLCANKRDQRERLLQDGIQSPVLYSKAEDCIFPVIARRLYHERGRDFNVVEDVEKARIYLSEGYYLQRLVEKKDEYRLFVFKGKIIEANIKTVGEGEEEMVRNHDNGYNFKIVRLDTLPEDMRSNARAAVVSLELHWGGVDCCTTVEGGYSIFEVNSAPAINERKCQKLAARINEAYGLGGGAINE